MSKKEYISTGDGMCQFAEQCDNFQSEYCYVCLYNTGATPRNYYKGEELTDDEKEMIES